MDPYRIRPPSYELCVTFLSSRKEDAIYGLVAVELLVPHSGTTTSCDTHLWAAILIWFSGWMCLWYLGWPLPCISVCMSDL